MVRPAQSTSVKQPQKAAQTKPTQKPAVRKETEKPAKRRTEGLYPEENEKKEKKKKKSVYFWRKVIVLLLAAAFILVGIWGVKTFKKLFGSTETTTNENPHGSRGVSFSNGINLGLGLTQSQIERNFGRPVSQKSGVCRYESSILNDYGVPVCVAQVRYSGSIASEILILDTVELGDEAEGAFLSAVIPRIKGLVRRKHADQGHILEIQTLCNHLRSDQDGYLFLFKAP